MGRIEKQKRQLIEESNKRILNEGLFRTEPEHFTYEDLPYDEDNVYGLHEEEDDNDIEFVTDKIEKPNVRRERFLRVAPKMVNDALINIRRMERLAQKSNYSATPDELKQIIKALNTETKILEKVLFNKNDESIFTFSEQNIYDRK